MILLSSARTLGVDISELKIATDKKRGLVYPPHTIINYFIFRLPQVVANLPEGSTAVTDLKIPFDAIVGKDFFAIHVGSSPRPINKLASTQVKIKAFISIPPC